MNPWAGLARFLIGLGLFLTVFGGFLLLFGGSRLFGPGGIGRLPGDILIRRGSFALYIPITTMLLVSLVLTLLARLLRR